MAAAPYVAGGSAVTGYECDTAGTGAGDCALPTGSVNYATGTGETYGLTVPNWAGGPAGPAAIVRAHRSTRRHRSPTTEGRHLRRAQRVASKAAQPARANSTTAVTIRTVAMFTTRNKL